MNAPAPKPSSTAIVPAASAAPVPFEPENMGQLWEMSQRLAKSSLLPTPLRGKPEDVMVTLLTGHELGLSSMQSIRGMSVIEGKGCLNADTIVGLCLSHPSVCEYFQLLDSSDKLAVYETKRRGGRPTKMSFSIEQAKAAGIAGKQNWARWPAAMLRARCATHLARAVYPDLAAGIYSDDEGSEILASSRTMRAERAVEGEVMRGEVVADAPDHDPETGEVPPDDSAALLEAIGAAPTIDALRVLVPRLSALGAEAKARVREVYAARQRALREADELRAQAAIDAAPDAVVAAGAAEPGSEG